MAKNHHLQRKNTSNAAIAIFFIIFFIFSPCVSGCGSCGGAVPIPNLPTPGSGPSPTAKCPRDALKFGVCAGVLKNLIKEVRVGDKLNKNCCTVLDGLLNLEAAVCLCTAIKGNILGLSLNIPISLSLLLNVCNKSVPPNYQCV